MAFFNKSGYNVSTWQDFAVDLLEGGKEMRKLFIKSSVRRCALASAAMVMCLASVTMIASASKSETESEVETESLYNSFYGYEWGTSLEDIKEGEITDKMMEGAQYALIENVMDGVDRFELRTAQVGGYEATAAFFISENGLIAGGYDVDEAVMPSLTEKYFEVYDTPDFQEESEDYGNCYIWIDSEKNYIVMSEYDGIIYASCDSAVNEALCSIVEDHYGIDLESELNASGNLDNI